MNETERRSAALLFGEELALGEVARDALDAPDVAEAVRDRLVPSRLSRRMQQRALARGRLEYEQFSVAPMLAARAAVLGAGAAGPPRFLLRVDGATEVSEDILDAHELPYLRAWESPAVNGIDVYVPPEDRLEPDQYTEKSKVYAAISGGVASVPTLGWHPTPLWRGDAVYVPAYVRGARAVAETAARLIAAEAALWVPVAVQPHDETDEDLAAMARALRGYARDWDEFLAAVRASR